jgi:hypothetical protein
LFSYGFDIWSGDLRGVFKVKLSITSTIYQAKIYQALKFSKPARRLGFADRSSFLIQGVTRNMPVWIYKDCFKTSCA